MSIAIYDEFGWHFDSNDGIVTLVLRYTGAGGAFRVRAQRARSRRPAGDLQTGVGPASVDPLQDRAG